MGRRPVRRGVAAAGRRPDDGLRVADRLAGGPGPRPRGLGRGLQRSEAGPTAPASRSTPATTAPTSTRPWPACGRSTRPASSRPSTTRAPPARPRSRWRWQQAGIPRVASNVTSDDWDDQNAYPLDASGTGGMFLHPQALIDAGVTDDRHHPGRPARGLGAHRPARGRVRRRRGEFVYRRPRARRARPTTASSSSAPRTPGPAACTLDLGRAGGRPGHPGRRAARHRPEDRHRPGHVLPRRRRRASATSPTRWCSTNAFPPATVDLPGLRGPPGRPGGVGRGAAPAGEPAVQPDALVDRALRPAPHDPRRRDDRVHQGGHHRRCSTRPTDVPMLGHVRRRELDAGHRPPGHLPAGRHRPLRRPTAGTREAEAPRRARGQLRRDGRDQLRRGAVRLAVRRPEPC